MSYADNDFDQISGPDDDNILNRTFQNALSVEGTDIIFAMTFNVGKAVKALFDIMSDYSDIRFRIFPEGLQIYEKLVDGDIMQETIDITFDAKRQQEFIFCPKNYVGENINQLFLKVSANSLKQFASDNRKGTYVRFVYSMSRLDAFYITSNDGTQSEVYIPVVRMQPDNENYINGTISMKNIESVCKIPNEILSKVFKKVSKKIGTTNFNVEVQIYTSGSIFVKSLAPSGEMVKEPANKPLTGPFYKFIIPYSCAKRFEKLCKVTSPTTIFIYAFDEKILRFSQFITYVGCIDYFYIQNDRLLLLQQQQNMIAKSKKNQSGIMYPQQTPIPAPISVKIPAKMEVPNHTQEQLNAMYTPEQMQQYYIFKQQAERYNKEIDDYILSIQQMQQQQIQPIVSNSQVTVQSQFKFQSNDEM